MAQNPSFYGVRGLVTDQDYNVSYKGGTVAPYDNDKVHMDNDFWGVGIRMGANTLWGLREGIWHLRQRLGLPSLRGFRCP